MSTQNELQVFENEQFGEVRTITIDGDPWFVAADVCKALGISNATDAIKRLGDDEKARLNLGLRGGDTNVVNEFGLYILVMGSRKPNASAFKHWIAHDVVPAIRKTGGFVADADAFLLNYLPNADEPTKLMFRAQLSVIRDLDSKVARQNKLIEEQTQTIESQGQEITTMKPKASYCDSVLATNNVVPITVIAKDYGMSAKAMNQKLKEMGIQYECRGTWVPYARFQGCGYTKTRTFLYDNGHGGSGSGVHTCWTQKGRMFLYDKLKAEGILPVMEQDG